MQHCFRERNVVLHHEAFVRTGRIRAGALMEDTFDAVRKGVSAERLKKFLGLHEIDETQIVEIFEVLVSPVHNQNFGVATAVQGLNEIASNKSGAAGYDPHGCECFGASFVELKTKFTQPGTPISRLAVERLHSGEWRSRGFCKFD